MCAHIPTKNKENIAVKPRTKNFRLLVLEIEWVHIRTLQLSLFQLSLIQVTKFASRTGRNRI